MVDPSMESPIHLTHQLGDTNTVTLLLLHLLPLLPMFIYRVTTPRRLHIKVYLPSMPRLLLGLSQL